MAVPFHARCMWCLHYLLVHSAACVVALNPDSPEQIRELPGFVGHHRAAIRQGYGVGEHIVDTQALELGFRTPAASQGVA